jgi:hypothetical protein
MNNSPNRDMVIFTAALQLPAGKRAAYLANWWRGFYWTKPGN